MKISKYTFLFDDEGKEFYVYNTLSNALIEIDGESYDVLREARRANADVAPTSLDAELYDALVLKKIVTENETDDFLAYKSIIAAQRAGTHSMHMTLAPTMDCCFRCHYCFEKHKEPVYMSEEVMDSIVKYLNSLESKPEFRLTWFGGEPLMALEQMEKFYEKLSGGYKIPTTSDVITTGYHITEAAIEVLEVV